MFNDGNEFTLEDIKQATAIGMYSTHHDICTLPHLLTACDGVCDCTR